MMNPNKGNSVLNTLWTMMDNAISRVFTAMPILFVIFIIIMRLKFR